MNRFIFSFLVLLFLIFLSPGFLEGAKDPCHALEKRLISLTGKDLENDLELMLIQLGTIFSQGISKGNITRNYITKEMPNTPPSITCTVLYWNSYLRLYSR